MCVCVCVADPDGGLDRPEGGVVYPEEILLPKPAEGTLLDGIPGQKERENGRER